MIKFKRREKKIKNKQTKAMSYYDLDDILSEEERVNVKFNEYCSGIGFLD